MHIKSTWSYIHKGLLAILSILVVSSLAAIIFLTHTLLGLNTLTTESSKAVGTAFVLQDVLTNLQELQTSVRGYVLTADKAFLSPYERANSRIPSDLKIIHNQELLLSGKQIKRIEGLITSHQDIMSRTITLRDTEGFESAQSLVASRQGEKVMNDFRTEITAISSYGLQNIGPMQQQSRAEVQRAIWVAATLGALVVATSVAVIWYFKRAILQERALESTKNEFLSLASHQLRTPATNVKQYIGLLMDGYMGDLTEQQRNALTVAYKNNEAEINIMNDLLDVAKLDLDRIQLHKKITNVRSIANQVVKEYSTAAKERNQVITLEGPKQVMASVDEAYVKGIIENLLDNAVKYSRDGTRIVITVDRQQDNVCVEVKDRGLGIKKRDFARLFNKFSRLDNEFSANSQGSGLGLYWAKQIIRLHGGTIELSSREGKGSVFTVKLPVR